MSDRRAVSRLEAEGRKSDPIPRVRQPRRFLMNPIRKLVRSSVAAMAAAAMVVAPMASQAGVGYITLPDLAGTWIATLGGFTGCGQSAMHVVISMNNAGSGTATITGHGQCGDGVTPGQTFKVLTLNSNGTGTAGLSCGAGCGWSLRIQVSPDRQTMNLVDVDPANPGNFLVGTAIHF